MGGDDAAALELRGVWKHFGRQLVLRDITLQVQQQRVAILGPNGSGKSTLLRIAATTSPATRGTVHIAGIDARRNDAAARCHLAYVPQDAPVYPELTPREQLRWWRRLHGRPADPETIDRHLDAAGLLRLGHRPAGTLSRGQRQRLALATAFASEAPLLLLDEPFTALDEAGRHWLEAAIREHPGAVLVALHDPQQAARLCHRRVRLLDHGLQEEHDRRLRPPEAGPAGRPPSRGGATGGGDASGAGGIAGGGDVGGGGDVSGGGGKARAGDRAGRRRGSDDAPDDAPDEEGASR